MRKINYKKIAVHSILWLLVISILSLFIYKMYIIPISEFAYSFISGLYIFAQLTIFYIGLIKVIDWIIKGFNWLLENR